jgi:hypothetical protein
MSDESNENDHSKSANLASSSSSPRQSPLPRILLPRKTESKHLVLNNDDDTHQQQQQKQAQSNKTSNHQIINNKECQTDWSWIQDMQLIEKIKREGGDLLKDILEEIQFQSESGTPSSASSENEDENESEIDIEFNEQKNKVKSKSGTTRSNKKSVKTTTTATTIKSDHLLEIGPPKILKYQPEIKQQQQQITNQKAVASPSNLSLDSEPIENLGQFMNDFNIYINGGQPCEFCTQVTKPWPTINAQEAKNPDTVCKKKFFF